jgi:hydroxymethylglutaryl-CoA lyase
MTIAKKSSKTVEIVEVGLRDGLQNEKKVLTANQKIELGRKLIECGLNRIELGSFVRADRIPQMADSDKVVNAILKLHPNVMGSVLVPNEKGMLEALKTNIKEIAFFTACSESFTQKNINCSIDESFERFQPVLKLAKKHKIKIRGYLSTAFGCPFEGEVSEKKVVELVTRLNKLGCYEISVGDTIGVAVPKQVQSVFKKLKTKVPIKKLAGHFHNTRGTALANISAAYDVGVRIFDSSIGGLGGCPYAPGAAGNVATEDVVYFFEKSGVNTGVNKSKIIATNQWLSEQLGRPLTSAVGKAGFWP